MAQGSIKKYVAKDGTISWRARADGGTDPATGARRQVLKTFRIRTEAQAWVREQQRRADQGDWAHDRKTTLAQWVTQWLDGPGARGRRDSTVRTYATLLQGRVVKALGHVALAKLTPAALERHFHDLEQELKPASVRTIYAALRVCLGDAERLGLLPSNPLRRVRPTSVPSALRKSWTPEEARRFLATVESSEDYALWLLLLTCGLRIGEVLALTWSDCDFDHGLLHVRRTMTTNRAGDATIGTTTKGGKARTMPMPPSLAGALRAQRARVLSHSMEHRDVWQDQDLAFPNPVGSPRRAHHIRTQLRSLCQEADVPPFTPHGLRHTMATLLAEHAPVAVARDMLGHSSLAVTNTYVHSSDQSRRAGSDKLAEILTT